MLRFLTAGESHGPALVVTVEDRPVAVSVTMTATWGTAARDGSVTVPTMRPALSWAAAIAGMSTHPSAAITAVETTPTDGASVGPEAVSIAGLRWKNLDTEAM